MRKNMKGRLIAMLAASTLIAVPAMAQTNVQTAAYQQAIQQGPAGLTAFMRTYPNSPLVPEVIAALAAQIGPQAAIQAALDAGVPTETVLSAAADIAPGVFTTTGQQSAGQWVGDSRPETDTEDHGPY